MSTEDHDGLSFEKRFRMACEEVSKRCGMACQTIKTDTYAWLAQRYNETEDQLDSQDSPISLLRNQQLDWLPQASESELDPTDVGQCLQKVEVDLLMFQTALDLALSRGDQEPDESSEARSTALSDARQVVDNILSDISTTRGQLGLAGPDIKEIAGTITSKFQNDAPSTSNDRYDWEYLILKQLMEYFHYCCGLFEQLDLGDREEL